MWHARTHKAATHEEPCDGLAPDEQHSLESDRAAGLGETPLCPPHSALLVQDRVVSVAPPAPEERGEEYYTKVGCLFGTGEQGVWGEVA